MRVSIWRNDVSLLIRNICLCGCSLPLWHIPAGKKLLSISGQIGNDIEGKIAKSLEDQYRLALQNINLIVESQGGTKEAIAKITIFMTDEPDWVKINSAADEFLPSPRPSMSFIYVKGLFRADIKVEIEALAAVY